MIGAGRKVSRTAHRTMAGVVLAVVTAMMPVFVTLVLAELVVHYTFDDGSGSAASDAAGSNETGTLINMEATDWVTGRIGSCALSFDGISATGRGTDEYVSAGTADALNLGHGSFTLTAWVRDMAPHRRWVRGIVTKSDAGDGRPGFALTTRGLRVRAEGQGPTDLEFSNIPLGEWVHLAAVRDAEAGELRLYVNAGLDNRTRYPGDLSLVNNRANLIVGANHKPSSGDGPGVIGSHSYFQGLIDDVRVYRHALTPAEIDSLIPETEGEADGVLLFCGPSSAQFGLQQSLAAAFGKERVSIHNVLSVRAAVFPINDLRLDSSPSPRLLRRASHIVLIDMPLGPPERMLPRYMLEGMQEAVSENGAHLVAFGGMFAFGKGKYGGSPLAEMLPVNIPEKWNVKAFPTPQKLEATTALVPSPLPGAKPAVLWYHDQELKRDDGIEVLAMAGSKPILVRWKYGKGTVTVFLGAAYGSLVDFQAAGVTPFWTWEGWETFAQNLVRGTP